MTTRRPSAKCLQNRETCGSPRSWCHAAPGAAVPWPWNLLVRRYLRPGCGLVCRRPAVRGLPTAAQGTAAAVPGAGGGRQHPGHHQVSLLEDDPGEPERCLCLYQSEGVLYSPGDSGAVCLHPCGHRTYSETTHPAGALRPSPTRGGALKSLLAGDPCVNGDRGAEDSVGSPRENGLPSPNACRQLKRLASKPRLQRY